MLANTKIVTILQDKSILQISTLYTLHLPKKETAARIPGEGRAPEWWVRHWGCFPLGVVYQQSQGTSVSFKFHRIRGEQWG